MPDIEQFSIIGNPDGFAGSPVGFGGTTADSAMSWLNPHFSPGGGAY